MMLYDSQEVYTGFWWENIWERNHLGDPGIDGRILLRWIFRKRDVGLWTGPDTCECVNEHSGSIKYGEFLD